MKRSVGWIPVLMTMVMAGSAATSSTAHEAGDWILRVGAAAIRPDDSSSLISTSTTGPLAGTGVDVKSETQGGLNLVYMVTDNWAVEVLAATPSKHDLKAQGLEAYGFNVSHLASVTHLPPTVTGQYYFGNARSRLRPFVGLGLNFTSFFYEDLTVAAQQELAADTLKLEDSWGIAYRAGVDFELNDRWLINASVWNIDIDTEASFQSSLGTVNLDASIDPWVYMISLGYRF